MSLFDESNKENLPLLRMELTFDDRRMQFYPQYEELEELALFVVTLICKTLQNIPTVSNILYYMSLSMDRMSWELCSTFVDEYLRKVIVFFPMSWKSNRLLHSNNMLHPNIN